MPYKRLFLKFSFAALIPLLMIMATGCKGDPTPTSSTATFQPVDVTTGNIAVSVSSFGNVISQSVAKLTFGSAGTITAINVKIGDKVTAGQVLASIDPLQLQTAVTQAKSSLDSAKGKLDQILTGPTIDDISSAQYSLNSAINKLELMKAGPTKDEINSAKLSFAAAQATYDKVAAGPTTAEIAAAESTVAQAQATLDSTTQKLADLKAGPSEVDQAQAQAGIDSAKASAASSKENLDKVLAGPDPAALLAAELSLNQAHISKIQADLAVAAIDGRNTDPLGSRVAAQLSAQLNEEKARANYEALKAGPTAAEIAAAQAQYSNATANLLAAKAKLDTLKAGPTVSEMSVAQAAVISAKANLLSTQAKLIELKQSPLPTDLNTALANLVNARIQLDSKLNPYTEQVIKDQTNAVNQSKISLAQKMNPYTDLDKAQAKSSVEQAQLNFDNAKKNLSSANLIAPFNGVVSAVTGNQGESSSGSSIQVIDPSKLRIDVTVDEVDVTSIRPGMIAVVSMDSLAGRPLRGTVMTVSPQGTTSQGVTNYPASIFIDPQGVSVPIGASATVQIISQSKQNVLLVPSSAVKTTGREKTVQVVAENGLPTNRTVTTGLSNGTQIEVVTGLTAGEKVLARVSARGTTTSAPTNSQANQDANNGNNVLGGNGGNLFGGGGAGGTGGTGAPGTGGAGAGGFGGGAGGGGARPGGATGGGAGGTGGTGGTGGAGGGGNRGGAPAGGGTGAPRGQ